MSCRRGGGRKGNTMCILYTLYPTVRSDLAPFSLLPSSPSSFVTLYFSTFMQYTQALFLPMSSCPSDDLSLPPIISTLPLAPRAHALVTLDLSYTGLQDVGVQILARALVAPSIAPSRSSNSSDTNARTEPAAADGTASASIIEFKTGSSFMCHLQELCLGGNMITVVGATALAQAIGGRQQQQQQKQQQQQDTYSAQRTACYLERQGKSTVSLLPSLYVDLQQNCLGDEGVAVLLRHCCGVGSNSNGSGAGVRVSPRRKLQHSKSHGSTTRNSSFEIEKGGMGRHVQLRLQNNQISCPLLLAMVDGDAVASRDVREARTMRLR